MEIKAFKMDGLGNDFVIIDQRKEKISLSNDQIIKICDRKFIGCDQLIFVKFSNIILHSKYRTSGRTLADWCRSLCYQRHRKLLFLRKRRQIIIEVQKVNK